MQENEKNITWNDIQETIHQAYGTVIATQRETINSKDTLATELISDMKKQVREKDIQIRCMIAGAALAASLMAVLFFRNDDQWRQAINHINQSWIDYLSQYDFVSQDGEGINYYNSDVGGDVNNGATDTP